MSIPFLANNCTHCVRDILEIQEVWRLGEGGETGGVTGGAPLRGKMGRGVLEESEHLAGDQKGFHTSCGRLFEPVRDFIPS